MCVKAFNPPKLTLVPRWEETSHTLDFTILFLAVMKPHILWFLLLFAAAGGMAASSLDRRISLALDRAQRHIDEFGTISISAPILTYARSNEFAFRLTNGASFYFNSAKTNTQGRAASFQQSFQSLLLQGQAEADPIVAGAYMAASQNYLQQQAAYQLSQQTLKQAAEARLQAALASAATNKTPGASNLAVAEALRAYAEQIYPSNQPPTFPVAASFNTGNLPAAPTTLHSLLTDTNYGRLHPMQAFLGLLNSMPSGLGISDRAALLTAAGDNAVESFFRALGDSSLYTNFLNPELYFGAVTVSINPGWRTRRNWAGEVSVTVDLEFSDARRPVVVNVLNDPRWPANLRAAIGIDHGYVMTDVAALKTIGIDPQEAANLANATPVQRTLENIPRAFLEKRKTKPVAVMVLSPMIESETFDLASSYRQQNEFALSLAAALTYAGAKAQAAAFEKFAKSRQYDIATRSPLATVNAFCGQDGSFGFQIGPRPRALENPADRRSGPADILDRQAFPALLILTASEGELEPRVVLNTNDVSPAFRLHEPYLCFRQISHWIPLKQPFFSFRDWHRPKDWFGPGFSERERIKAAHALEQALKGVTNSCAPKILRDPLRERIRFCEREIIGTVDTIGLPPGRLCRPPPQEEVQVDGVYPRELHFRARSDGPCSLPFELTFSGQNLDLLTGPVFSVFGNTTVPIISASPSHLLLKASLTNLHPPAVAFQFPLKAPAKAPCLFSPAIPLRVDPPRPRLLEAAPKTITLKRDDQGAPLGRDVSVLFVGQGLHSLDTNAANVRILSGGANLRNVLRLGDALKVYLNVTNAGEAIVLEFPLATIEGSASDYLITPGIQVEFEPSLKKETK